MTLGDHVTIFFRSPSLEQSLCGIVHHFSHGNILVTWKLEEVTSECVGYVLNVGHLAALSQGRLEHLSWRMFLERTLNERWRFWHLDRVWSFLPRHQTVKETVATSNWFATKLFFVDRTTFDLCLKNSMHTMNDCQTHRAWVQCFRTHLFSR